VLLKNVFQNCKKLLQNRFKDWKIRWKKSDLEHRKKQELQKTEKIIFSIFKEITLRRRRQRLALIAPNVTTGLK
jgi:hypothetical protein